MTSFPGKKHVNFAYHSNEFVVGLLRNLEPFYHQTRSPLLRNLEPFDPGIRSRFTKKFEAI